MFSKYLLFFASFYCVANAFVIPPDLPERFGDKFIYFGYGSNMLTKRIHIQNPTAQKIGMGILKDYRLDFNTFTERWGGAPATIVPTNGAYVYGTLWEIDLSNLADIDDQEGVHEGIYYPVSLPVMLPNNTLITARAYLLTDQPKIPIHDFLSTDTVPIMRQPSKTYLQCLVKGAEETGIVPWYVDWLKSVKHNGHVAKDLELILELKDVKLAN
ncbi:gamma-glutamylcyclotransferase-like [Anastrepha obliqua]|uniref:gamma-glutamylcyclotransferase-like n=1 Tax=Anastrepha obliqua TaxID=95512 RepID=UPI0024098886|nr:gamma-glutamylcyclotransferase-like [Anastrepha obliqua]